MKVLHLPFLNLAAQSLLKSTQPAGADAGGDALPPQNPHALAHPTLNLEHVPFLTMLLHWLSLFVFTQDGVDGVDGVGGEALGLQSSSQVNAHFGKVEHFPFCLILAQSLLSSCKVAHLGGRPEDVVGAEEGHASHVRRHWLRLLGTEHLPSCFHFAHLEEESAQALAAVTQARERRRRNIIAAS